ncbi:hypothetical protein T4E_8704 [Trichinella pseudospiralis]|uniref:Uncharacterized protein n=1 Tax=Trichinella pseudospiralis TaxID=6337 RepID=A0A0V0Y021_TRIPS|nr:hypothetical protein T4E_8704 [Trichinella pseudospiralis]
MADKAAEVGFVKVEEAADEKDKADKEADKDAQDGKEVTVLVDVDQEKVSSMAAAKGSQVLVVVPPMVTEQFHRHTLQDKHIDSDH